MTFATVIIVLVFEQCSNGWRRVEDDWDARYLKDMFLGVEGGSEDLLITWYAGAKIP